MREVDAYLPCGILEDGFIRAACENCRFEACRFRVAWLGRASYGPRITTITAQNVHKIAAAFEKKSPSHSLLIDLVVADRFAEARIVADAGIHLDREESSYHGGPLYEALRFAAPSRDIDPQSRKDLRALIDRLFELRVPLAQGNANSFFVHWEPEDEAAAVDLARDLVARASASFRFGKGIPGNVGDGGTFLHAAAAHFPLVIEDLLRAGVDPTVESWDGTAAHVVVKRLHHGGDRLVACLRPLLATRKPDADLLGTLLDQIVTPEVGEGAAEQAKGVEEMLPGILAACALLVEAGERVDAPDAQGRLPVDRFLIAMRQSGFALAPGWEEHVDEDGLEDEIYFEKLSFMGSASAQTYAREVVRFLVERGGASPRMLSLAATAHLPFALAFMLEHTKADATAPVNADGDTLLHAALTPAENRPFFSSPMTARTLKLLVDRGCSPEQKNAAGKSAIDLYAGGKKGIPAARRPPIERALGIGKGAKKAPAAKAAKPATKKNAEGEKKAANKG
ncbi:hypothetical protein [Polyangium sp. 15x6]|uniref:hypothetical protein n=1 Tax=Polyangium sp. 15x6 TaxID=3042687 RepID=UPI002499FB46|nr:hypothetical protein [Polyangium sp. 15x6]